MDQRKKNDLDINDDDRSLCLKNEESHTTGGFPYDHMKAWHDNEDSNNNDDDKAATTDGYTKAKAREAAKYVTKSFLKQMETTQEKLAKSLLQN